MSPACCSALINPFCSKSSASASLPTRAATNALTSAEFSLPPLKAVTTNLIGEGFVA